MIVRQRIHIPHCKILLNYEWRRTQLPTLEYNLCMKIFTERLQELAAGKTQKELAASTGIPQQTLSRYLTGKQMPDLARLAVLCRVLDTSSDYLIGLED